MLMSISYQPTSSEHISFLNLSVSTFNHRTLTFYCEWVFVEPILQIIFNLENSDQRKSPPRLPRKNILQICLSLSAALNINGCALITLLICLQYLQYVFHFAAIAMSRNLPSTHPVYKLLFPHVRYIPAINTVWRKALIPENMAFSQVQPQHPDSLNRYNST